MNKQIYLLLSGIVLMLSSCTNKESAIGLTNTMATVPASFEIEKNGLKVITSFLNKKLGTTATLYGNDLALSTAISGVQSFAPGQVWTLVTWKQQDDPNWFGAKIPAKVQSVETVKTVVLKAGGTVVNYQRFDGEKLTLNSDTLDNRERIKYIFGQKPSVMP